MAKQIIIKDGEHTYTLEYTRKSVATMEKQGFVAAEVDKKPVTLLPALFAGAFLAHHRFVKQDTIDKLYSHIKDKDSLIGKLVEMYNEPLIALLDDPESGEEGNVEWTADW